MPDVATPDPIGDQVEALAGGMFDPEVLGAELTLKCRYIYLHAKIEAIQGRGGEPSERLLDKLDELSEQLVEVGIRPSSLLDPNNQ